MTRIDPILLLLTSIVLLFAVLLIYVEFAFKQDAQMFQVMSNLLAGGFKGAVLPVGVAGAVSGVLAYKDIESLPIPPDLAIICGDGGDASRAPSES